LEEPEELLFVVQDGTTTIGCAPVAELLAKVVLLEFFARNSLFGETSLLVFFFNSSEEELKLRATDLPLCKF